MQECLAEGTGNLLSEEQLWLFQVSERCLLDMYKDNPVTRKVKSKYELNGQQDSLKFNTCKSSENSERIGKWWRKKIYWCKIQLFCLRKSNLEVW